MTLPHASRRGDRPAWPRVVAVVWMASLSAAAIVGITELSRLSDPRRAAAQDTRLQTLSARVVELERQAEVAKQQPKAASPSDLDSLRKTLQDRLTALEQVQASGASKEDLQAVLARLDALETRPRPQPPARPSAATLARKAIEGAKAPALDLPFRVVGLELRSGVRFLVIAPLASSALADTRLLREGGTDGPWRLQAIDGRVAVFRFADQTLRVAIP